MAQLHLYLPEDVALEVKRRASHRGISVSAYLAEIVRSQVTDEWPEDFFSKVVGSWAGEPLERPETLPLEERKELRDVPSRYERVHPDTK
ncbi:MAG TPA: hypothetical protein VLK65_06540 [Vicinamibacteria bacterium]|nr:hypothetical protein [Vicinamibacteria bacterium]